MLNRNFNDFKFQHKRNKNQILYTTRKIRNDDEILNLIDNFLLEKNSFVFESVEKGKIRGRYTIFGKNPDKIWEFNNNNSYLVTNKTKKRIKGKPEKIIEKIIEEFKFKIPSGLPPISSLISGYFSYDSIRYIEKIPNKCRDDLKLPDVRLLRPRVLVVHDNLKKKIFYIVNIFKDEKITNYKSRYLEIEKQINEIPTLELSSQSDWKIPTWTKTIVGWWNEEQLSDEVYEGVYWNQRLYYKIINEGAKEITPTGDYSWECRESDEIMFENRAEALRFKKMFVDAVHGRNTFGNSKWVPSMHEQLKKFFLGDWLQRYNRDTKSYDKVDRQEVFNEEAFQRFLDSTNRMSINQLYRN